MSAFRDVFPNGNIQISVIESPINQVAHQFFPSNYIQGEESKNGDTNLDEIKRRLQMNVKRIEKFQEKRKINNLKDLKSQILSSQRKDQKNQGPHTDRKQVTDRQNKPGLSYILKGIRKNGQKNQVERKLEQSSTFRLLEKIRQKGNLSQNTKLQVFLRQLQDVKESIHKLRRDCESDSLGSGERNDRYYYPATSRKKGVGLSSSSSKIYYTNYRQVSRNQNYSGEKVRSFQRGYPWRKNVEINKFEISSYDNGVSTELIYE